MFFDADFYDPEMARIAILTVFLGVVSVALLVVSLVRCIFGTKRYTFRFQWLFSLAILLFVPLALMRMMDRSSTKPYKVILLYDHNTLGSFLWVGIQFILLILQVVVSRKYAKS